MEKLDKYTVLGPVGPGAGAPLKAKTPEGTTVVLKVLSTAKLSDDLRQRFLREAEIGAKLDHPNLVKVIASGEADGYLYQAMESLDGKDLSRVLVESEPLSNDVKLSIMRQVCDALAYAHGLGLVHRDIKPENIFLERTGNIRILDFGSVKVSNSDLTQAGLSVGTLNFMAPEQVISGPVSPATDIFAAGAVFYQLISGAHPFSGRNKSLPEILNAIMTLDPLPLSVASPQTPAEWNDAVMTALRKDPKARWQSAMDFKAALGGPKDLKEPKTDPSKTRVLDANLLAQLTKRPVATAPTAPDPRMPGPSRRFCPQCTNANPMNAVECAKCGARLVNYADPARPNDPQKSSTTLYVVAGLLGFVAILLLVLVLILARRS